MQIAPPTTVLLLLLLATPAMSVASNTSAMSDLASDAFQPSLQGLVDVSQPRAPENLVPAMEAGAYHSVLAMLANDLADQREQVLWETAQESADPYEAYMHSVFEEGLAAEQALEGNLSRLQAATLPLAPQATAARLVEAAELLVQGESDLTLAAGFLAAPYSTDQLAQPFQRSSVLLPAIRSRLHSDMAGCILDDLPTTGDGMLNTRQLAKVVEAHGGYGTKWRYPSHGAFHDLARHVRIYGINQGNATVATLSQSVAELDRSFRANDPSALAMASARLDGAWWVERAGTEEVNPLWAPTINYLNGRSQAALYEQSLLNQMDDTGLPWFMWAAGIGALGAVASGALAIALRVRRSGRALAALLLISCFLSASVPALAHGTDNDHGTQDGSSQAAVVPMQQWPVNYTRQIPGGNGNLARSEDGELHFVWAACQESHAGCRDVYYRSRSAAGTWSGTQLLANPTLNVSLPRVVTSDGKIHAFWLEGTGSQQGQRKELWHCIVTETGCRDNRMVSPTGKLAAYFAADGADDRVFAAWSQEDTQAGMVFGRWWHDGAWGSTIALSDQTHLARYPDVVVAASQAHVVWQAGMNGMQEVGGLAGRTVEYVRLSSSGIVEGPAVIATGNINDRVRPVVAIQDSGTVGVAYNPYKDLFLIERSPGGAWTQPVNATGLQRSVSFPTLDAIGPDWMVGWTTGAIGTFHLWQAFRDQGFWLRPQIVVNEPPFDQLIVNEDVLIADGKVHTVWTGAPQGVDRIEMVYQSWLLDARPVNAPTISVTTPYEGAWAKGPAVVLNAKARADALLEPSGTRWEVDGAALETSISQDGSLSAQVSLPDGSHAAKVRVQDERGNVVNATVTFTVDSVAPTFSYEILSGTTAVGNSQWYKQPISFRAFSIQDSAPVETQYDVGGRGNWQEFKDSGTMPAGILGLRLRAVDAAGNVALAEPTPVGWDDTVPAYVLDVPHVSRSPTVAIAAATDEPAGSPVTLRFALSPSPSGTGTTFQTPAAASLKTPSLADGDYILSGDAIDAAGNQQVLDSWNFTVDTQAPSLEVIGTTLTLTDAGSGLAKLTSSGGLAATVTFTGEHEASWEARAAPHGSQLRITVEDLAGNAWNVTVDLATGHVEPIADPAFKVDAAESPSSPLTHKDIPTPGFEVGLVPVIGALLARRRK